MLEPREADRRATSGPDRDAQNGLPDDVAALFRWAGIEGMPYRNFSSAAEDFTDKPEQQDGAAAAGRQIATEPAERPTENLQEPVGAGAAWSQGQLQVAGPSLGALRAIGEPYRGPAGRSKSEGAEEPASDVEGMLPMRVPQRRSGRFWPSGLREHELPGVNRAGAAEKRTTPTTPESAMPLKTAADYRAETEGKADAAALKGSGDGSRVLDPTSTSPMPSWIAKEAHRPHRATPRATESLQTSRERVAGRWYALRGLLAAAAPQPQGAVPEAAEAALPPVLVIYSVAGGVGKTSLAASLTRALAAQGERVLLVDMTGHGVLPFFFGARELRSQERRTFSPPPGTLDAAIQLVTFPPTEGAGGIAAMPAPISASGTVSEPMPGSPWAERLREYSKGFTRVVVDVPPERGQELSPLLEGQGRVLVPLAPELSSVLSLRALRRKLAQMPLSAAAPAYLLMQYDPAERLHLDMRELLVQELGEALLPVAVRRSPLVSEALAQGMTVIDYAPEQEVAQDLREIAGWVRTTMEPHEDGTGQARWIER